MAIDVLHHRPFSDAAVEHLPRTTKPARSSRPRPLTGVDGAAYDPESADVFASNADGTLTVIHQTVRQHHVTQTITTLQFAQPRLTRQTTGLRGSSEIGRHRSGGRGRGPLQTQRPVVETDVAETFLCPSVRRDVRE